MLPVVLSSCEDHCVCVFVSKQIIKVNVTCVYAVVLSGGYSLMMHYMTISTYGNRPNIPTGYTDI